MGVFLQLKKAFDTVDQKPVLNKLHTYGRGAVTLMHINDISPISKTLKVILLIVLWKYLNEVENAIS